MKIFTLEGTTEEILSRLSQCHGHQLASNRCNLGGGSVWDVVVQPSPGFVATRLLHEDIESTSAAKGGLDGKEDDFVAIIKRA